MLKGGDKLITKLNDLAKETKTLKVGFFKNSTYPDGTYVAQNAFWQEYGTPKIPPRPFFRTAIAQNKGKWSKGFENVLVKNNYDYDVHDISGKCTNFTIKFAMNNNSQDNLSSIFIGFPYFEQHIKQQKDKNV